jgi:hypothetical protein
LKYGFLPSPELRPQSVERFSPGFLVEDKDSKKIIWWCDRQIRGFGLGESSPFTVVGAAEAAELLIPTGVKFLSAGGGHLGAKLALGVRRLRHEKSLAQFLLNI